MVSCNCVTPLDKKPSISGWFNKDFVPKPILERGSRMIRASTSKYWQIRNKTSGLGKLSPERYLLNWVLFIPSSRQSAEIDSVDLASSRRFAPRVLRNSEGLGRVTFISSRRENQDRKAITVARRYSSKTLGGAAGLWLRAGMYWRK
jgi:hypothetical protein